MNGYADIPKPIPSGIDVPDPEREASLPYERRCAEMLQKIRQSPELTVSQAQLGKVSKGMEDQDSIFADLAEDHEAPFSPEIRRHFFRFREVKCAWRASDPDSELVGEFNLFHLYRTVVEKRMHYIWEGENDWERELYPDLRIFDDTPHTGTGRMATLRLTPGTADPDIWYFDMRRGAIPMDIGYAAYLDNLLATKGVIGWQYLFCDVSLDETSVAALKAGLAEMLERFPVLFPDHEYAELVARYEQRL